MVGMVQLPEEHGRRQGQWSSVLRGLCHDSLHILRTCRLSRSMVPARAFDMRWLSRQFAAERSLCLLEIEQDTFEQNGNCNTPEYE